MSLRDIFVAELDSNGIAWCRGCERYGAHGRGFAVKETRTVHLESQVATRRTLHRGLHEIGHIVNDEAGMRRFEKELAANRFAERRMRELGIPVPRSEASKGRAYVARMKRWGNNISKAR